ncbi:phage integrase central domain-containing protein [Rhodococcoides fascians]|uniref:phage integrase central domain-containing protein n=1 Tax=Rhodococcoides fascians TaxID=1828 RepID=UPI00068946AD
MRLRASHCGCSARLRSVARQSVEIGQDARRFPQTIEQYRLDIEKTIAPAIGNLRIRECTTSRIDRHVKSIATQHPAKARRIKVDLAGILGIAVRHDAPPTNPVREIATIPGSKKNVRAIGLDELRALRERIRL